MSNLNQYPYLNEIQKLAKTTGQAVVLVGGFLRNYLLKRPSLDMDFAVSTHALRFAQCFAKRIKGAYIVLDEVNACGRVVKKYDEQVYIFDFAQYRAPSLLQDLKHRDFTINTFAVDIKYIDVTEKWVTKVKSFSSARQDLDKKIIRMVSAKAFAEDPLRLLRAYSLRASLNFKIEPLTVKQIIQDKALLHQVSMERIREELFKILESPRAAVVLKEMDRVGLLQEVMPQIQVMQGCSQGGYHHLDVWKHSLEAVTQVEKEVKSPEARARPELLAYLNQPLSGTHSRLAIIKLATLWHDIGKPDTRRKEGERFVFHAHECVGKGIVRHLGKMLKLSTIERFALENLVLWHLRPGYLSNFQVPTKKAVFRFFRDVGDLAPAVLFLSIADQFATRGPLTTEARTQHHMKLVWQLMDEYFTKKNEPPLVRLLDGRKVMKALKIKPSPLIGEILRAVDEAQGLGKIQTPQEAMALAQKIAQKNFTKEDADAAKS